MTVVGLFLLFAYVYLCDINSGPVIGDRGDAILALAALSSSSVRFSSSSAELAVDEMLFATTTMPLPSRWLTTVGATMTLDDAVVLAVVALDESASSSSFTCDWKLDLLLLGVPSRSFEPFLLAVWGMDDGIVSVCRRDFVKTCERCCM